MERPSVTDGVPPAVDAEIKADAATAAELLTHFWSARPFATAAAWDRAYRVNAALGVLYDRMETRKKTLTPAGRHASAGRLSPLIAAMDAAFSFYDEEKRTRAGSYAAFEREREARGGASAPIELS
jgi:transcription initiation factor TFIIH subunit 1